MNRALLPSLSCALALVLVGAGACASSSSASSAPPPAATPAAGAAPAAAPAAAKSGRSLYDRLGGLPAIDAVVSDFLNNVAGDVRIQSRFALTDLKDLHQKLVDQVCAATGGPCAYKGGDMKTVHKGMRIKSAEFDALVEDLVKSLDKFKVPAQEKGELLGALGPMKADIVEVP
ncbi:MAG TPA: group 1 truncated hemoglobin [Myxococcota bacterium]|jgi:hemoglobin